MLRELITIQADLLHRRHLSHQVRGALRRAQPPVLVRVEGAVAVQVPEAQPVLLQDRLHSGTDLDLRDHGDASLRQ
jgi:hypothetical protein